MKSWMIGGVLSGVMLVVLLAGALFHYNVLPGTTSPASDNNVSAPAHLEGLSKEQYTSSASFIVGRVGERCFQDHFVFRSIQKKTLPYTFLDGRAGETNYVVTFSFYPLPKSPTSTDVHNAVQVYLENTAVVHADGIYDLKNKGWCDYQIDKDQAKQIIIEHAPRYGYEPGEVEVRGIYLRYSNKHYKYTWQFDSCLRNKKMEIDPADGRIVAYYNYTVCGGVP